MAFGATALLGTTRRRLHRVLIVCNSNGALTIDGVSVHHQPGVNLVDSVDFALVLQQ